MKRFVFAIVCFGALLCSLCAGCKGGWFYDDSSISPEPTGMYFAGQEYTYEHLKVQLPEDFTVSEDGSAPVAVCPEYPDKGDNITFSKGGADDINIYTAQVLEDAYRSVMAGYKETLKFEKISIDGVDTIVFSFSAESSGVDMIETQYLVFGQDYSNIITFTSVTGDYDDDFEQMVKTIRII